MSALTLDVEDLKATQQALASQERSLSDIVRHLQSFKSDHQQLIEVQAAIIKAFKQIDTLNHHINQHAHHWLSTTVKLVNFQETEYPAILVRTEQNLDQLRDAYKLQNENYEKLQKFLEFFLQQLQQQNGWNFQNKFEELANQLGQTAQEHSSNHCSLMTHLSTTATELKQESHDLKAWMSDIMAAQYNDMLKKLTIFISEVNQHIDQTLATRHQAQDTNMTVLIDTHHRFEQKLELLEHMTITLQQQHDLLSQAIQSKFDHQALTSNKARQHELLTVKKLNTLLVFIFIIMVVLLISNIFIVSLLKPDLFIL